MQPEFTLLQSDKGARFSLYLRLKMLPKSSQTNVLLCSVGTLSMHCLSLRSMKFHYCAQKILCDHCDFTWLDPWAIAYGWSCNFLIIQLIASFVFAKCFTYSTKHRHTVQWNSLFIIRDMEQLWKLKSFTVVCDKRNPNITPKQYNSFKYLCHEANE